MADTNEIFEAGRIETTTLPRVFGGLCAAGATGALIIDLSAGSGRIYLRRGKPGGAVVAPGGKAYRLSDRQRATEMLVGLLKPITGTYRFDPAAELPPWSEASEVDPINVLVALFDRAESADRFGELLRVIGDESLRLTAEGSATAGRVIDEDARLFLGKMATPSDAVGLLAESGLEMQRAGAILAAAWCLGWVSSQSFEAASLEWVAPEVGGGGPSRPAGRGAEDDAALSARRSRLFRRALKNIPGAELLGFQGQSASSTGSDEKALVPGAASPLAAAASIVGADGEAPSQEAAAFIREIKTLSAELEKQDLYRRLGVTRSASENDIKAAYLSRAKRFHPDRAAALSLPPEEVKRLTGIFETMKEAYDTLGDKNRRKAYDLASGDGGGPKDRDKARGLARAEIDFKKGEALFKKKDYARALDYLGAAVSVDPRNGRWLVVYAWTKYNVGPRDKVKEDVRRLLQRAAGLEGSKGEANYYLGILSRIDGDSERAERYLALAVEHEPKLLEAASELRDVRRRLGKSVGTGGAKGLLKRVLGKG